MIPVLIADADLPAEASLPPPLRPLIYRNGIRIHPDQHFALSVELVLAEIRRPPRAAEDSSPINWVVDVLAQSSGPMMRSALLVSVAALVVITLVMAGSIDVANMMIASFIILFMLPGVCGFLVGLRHGPLNAFVWCALGLAVSTVQNMACFFAGSAIGAAADVLSGQSVGHWSDKGGYVSLPAGCFSLIGALVWTSRAAKQAQDADDPTRHNRPSLRNGAAGRAWPGWLSVDSPGWWVYTLADCTRSRPRPWSFPGC